MLINELGAVGLDHHLARGASETTRVLENGCVCCTVRDDLEAALATCTGTGCTERVPRFEQVVIETTGLADPGPILRVLERSGIVGERYRWWGIVCTIDACNGGAQLASRPEALRQAALPDVVITKTDVAKPEAVAALETRVHVLNPRAPRHHVTHGEASRELLAVLATRAAATTTDALVPCGPGWLPSRAQSLAHGGSVQTFTVAVPVLPRARLEHCLHAITGRHGVALLRMKGLVRASDDAHWLVVEAVHGRVDPLVALDMPDGECAPGTLVLIVAGDGAASAAIAASVHGTFDAAAAAAHAPGAR